MTYLAIALVVLAVSAIVAWDLWRSKRKKKAPRASIWIGPIGIKDAQPWQAGATITQLVDDIEAFTGRKLEPVVIVFRPDPIKLPTGGIAAGVYHSVAKGWDHAWIEIYSWAALAHELLHHATGLEDTPEFRKLLERFEMRVR
jgi:hypothetical protein